MPEETTPSAVETTPEVVIQAPAPEPVAPAPQPAEQNWLLSESEDLQNDPTLNQYKTKEEALRGFIETKKMIGDRVKVPDETTTPEERERFYTRLGRPESPDKYEFSPVELPTGMPVDEGTITNFKKRAFEKGLTKEQADAIYTGYMKDIGEMHTKILSDYEAGMNQQMEVLKGRWGDQFESNRTLAMNSFKHFASPALQATVEREGWGNNPDFVELFQKIGAATAEDILRSGGQVQYRDIDEKIKVLDREVSTLAENDPVRKEKLAERDRLYKERYPDNQY
jgi:hypothetical protein